MGRDRRDVVAVVYDQLCTFEFGIAVEIFGLPRPELDVDWYRFSVCSPEPGPLTTTAGVSVQATSGRSVLPRTR
jgi:AraC family transcriptional regulator, transcriptional activator FtrA